MRNRIRHLQQSNLDFEGRNVLLVHDHRVLRHLLSKRLQHAGHFCFAAASFIQAEQILRETRVHIVLCDCSIDGEFPLDFIQTSVVIRKIPYCLISVQPEFWNDTWGNLQHRKIHVGRIIDLQQEQKSNYTYLLKKVAEAPLEIDSAQYASI